MIEMEAALHGMQFFGQATKALDWLGKKLPQKEKEEVEKLQAILRDTNSAYLEQMQSLNAALKRIIELEKQVTENQNWAAETEKYKFEKIGNVGISAYTYCPSQGDTTPIHYLCYTCFQNQKKSVLQPNMAEFNSGHILTCGTCKVPLRTGGIGPVKPLQTVARSTSSWVKSRQ